MKVFVTGGGGYIGTSLVPMLLEAGHQVTVVDRFFFGDQVFAGLRNNRSLRLVRDDVRWFDGKLLSGHDAVIDMAALSNDPAGELDPWKTFEINYLGRVRTCRLAREAGVSRYLLTSSCSVYGFRDGLLDETTPPNPLTAYARANILAEGDTLPLGTPTFCPSAVRFATLYGLSGRMRFDLAINAMVLGARTSGKIPIMKDGTQWRPFLHVRDAARALIALLAQNPSLIQGHVFNIGSDEQNYQVAQLAELVAASLSKRPTLEWYGDPDLRSYRVNFRRAREDLRFAPRLTPADATKEIESALDSGALVPSPQNKTVDWYHHLLKDPDAGKSVALHGIVL
ncbi:MAG: NAD-dependent epimerase/dehydratase family protein [Thermoplasmata archaeon]